MPRIDNYFLLRSVVRLANGKHPFQHKLHGITRLLVDSLGLSDARLFLFNERKRAFTGRITASSAEPVVEPCYLPAAEGICGRAFSEGRSIVSDADSCHPEERFRRPSGRLCAIPLVEEGTVYGACLFLLDETAGIPDLAGDSFEDLSLVVTGVLRGVKVAEWSDRRLRNLNTLNALANVLNQSLPPDELLPRIIEACHAFSGSCCTILRISSSCGSDQDYRMISPGFDAQAGHLESMEADAALRASSSALSVLRADLVAEEELPPSLVCVPLIFEGEVKGTLTFFGRIVEEGGMYNFDEEDRELFENMGILIINAVEGANHYQRTLSLSRENEKRVKELSLLYRISNIMLSTVKLNKLVTITLSSLTSTVPRSFDRAMLFLINEKAHVMQGMLGVATESTRDLVLPFQDHDLMTRAADLSDEDVHRLQDSEFCRRVRTTRISLEKEISSCLEAVRSRRLVIVDDAEAVDAELVEHLVVSSCAIAPLVAREQVIGIIIVDNAASGRPIEEDEVRFLQLVTNQAGMAIENSMLYTRLKEANKDLCDIQERLIQGERLAAIGEMAASIAHELKTPLISIGGFARRLGRGAAPGSDEQQAAETIVREVDRLEKMLTDVLSFSRKTSICYTTFRVTDVIEETLALVATSLEENRITVDKRIDHGVPEILADRQQLKQVFLNLIFNAQEAMRDGGTLGISTGKGRLRGAAAIEIKISDTGGGIPMDILSNIFNPFFTTKTTGTGLGLPIVNRIIGNHLGSIEVRNNPPVGASFVITLPFRP